MTKKSTETLSLMINRSKLQFNSADSCHIITERQKLKLDPIENESALRDLQNNTVQHK